MTTTTNNLTSIAAAGLGRKFSAMTTNQFGTVIAAATNGQTWVEVVTDSDPADPDGVNGSITPAPDRGNEQAAAVIGGRDLRRIVAGILPATDKETSRYALGGTLVEIAEGALLVVVGTDGRRLHAGHVQPVAIRGQLSPVVHADHWAALIAAVKAAGKQIVGVTGKRLDAVIDRGTVRIEAHAYAPTGGTVVAIQWTSAAADTHGREITVRATALAVAGRFPRWRDCLPEGGQTLAVDPAAVAAAAGEFDTLHRAAERAGKAAWKAEQAERKARRQPTGPDFQIDRGAVCGPAGMIGRGVEWSAAFPATPVETILDQRYLKDAMLAAVAWGAETITVTGTDDISAVMFTTGEYGPQFTAVIMPLARD